MITVYIVFDWFESFIILDPGWEVVYAGTDYDAAVRKLNEAKSQHAHLEHWQCGERVKTEQRGAK